ncbi:MAG: FAD-dependent oxidoreductase [Spirochaetales bacterium]|nr:FAD-dependent oxidoreductase [Spirochaetales bacterium]
MSEKIKYIDTDQYDKEVLAGGKVVLDFYSTECPPCEALAAKYEQLSLMYGEDIKFLKIFRQENRALAEKLGVSGSPTVLFYNNGERTGDVLTGGIKRSELIKNLDALLPEERITAIKAGIKPRETTCDLLILGGGPAGLTAGIYAAQAKINVLLVDIALTGGQVKTTHMVSNYPGFKEPQPGYMLMHYMQEQAVAAGVEFRQAVDVTSINLQKKEILIDNYETIRAKKIIIATGSSPKPLGLPGEKEYRGKGISYCATCDAKYYEGKEIILIGGGNSAIEEALFIARFASKITIVHQFAVLQANKVAQEKAFANEKINFLFEHEPRAFIKRDNGDMAVVVENLKTGERTTLETRGVFVFAGMQPNLDGIKGNNDLAYDKWGYIQVDDLMHTNIPDVFAAGDVASKPLRQITIATSEGTIAAVQAARELE